MEKQISLRKTGPIACPSSGKIQQLTDFQGKQEEHDSGMEMNPKKQLVDLKNTPSLPLKSLKSLQEHAAAYEPGAKAIRLKGASRQSIRQVEFVDKRRTSDRLQLQKIIKTRDMVKMFFEKTTFNSILRKPVSYNPFQNIFSQENVWFFQRVQLNINKNAINFIYLAKLIFIVFFFFIFPLSLLYHTVEKANILFIMKCAAILFNFYDFCQTLQKNYSVDNNLANQQKYLTFRRDKKISMVIQLLTLILTIASVVLSWNSVESSNILFLSQCLNISHFVQQLHKLQDKFINGSQLQKYWSLFKVIIKNLFVCHLLACTLIAIASLNPDNNWMTPTNIDQLQWFQQYIWSYYFGTTIILTIGFGDLHANNSTEAFFIIVISFFACVFFGYNINYIGNLINSIKQQEYQRNHKLKVLSSLAKKSKVSKNICDDISRYIVEQSKIKQKSDYKQQKKLLKELPQTLRTSFLQQANQKLFNHLRLLIHLGNKSIQKLSLKIQAHFCHPDQMIKGPQSPPNIMILQSGEVGFVTRAKYPSRLRNIIIQRINSKLQTQSRIVCLDFIGQPLNYDIKSLDYSIIYEMSKTQFQQTIIASKKDYQSYRELIDRCKYKLNQFGLIKCRFCQNQMHTLFQCPRVHYQPFRKTLPLKYNKSKKVNFKQSRVKFQRNKMQRSCEVIVQARFLKQLQFSDPKESKSVISIQKVHKIRDYRQSSNKMKKGITLLRPQNQNVIMTIQMLRDDIKNLKRTSVSNFQFTLWDNVDCDQACNFQYYFPKFNPDILGEKSIKNTLMSKTNRIKRKAKIYNNL